MALPVTASVDGGEQRCPSCQQPLVAGERRCRHCLRSLVPLATAASASDAAVATGPLARLRLLLAGELAAMRAWAQEAMPWPRWLLFLLMLWLAWNTSFIAGGESLFWGINLGIHEAGHLLTTWAPHWWCALSGTLAQCGAPLIALVVLRRQGDWAGVAFCISWLGTNCNYVSWYCADAQAMQAQLVSVGSGGPPLPKEDMHDWHVILDGVGLLAWDGLIAGIWLLVGAVCLWGGVVLLGWQLWVMHRHRA